mmetsp:Transcript_2723/g.10896  ORF Transcript_2723/g.10896 Transcript_2723/m.10896 type:complete len:252 (-) Transcript_2723:9-764(-)
MLAQRRFAHVREVGRDGRVPILQVVRQRSHPHAIRVYAGASRITSPHTAERMPRRLRRRARLPNAERVLPLLCVPGRLWLCLRLDLLLRVRVRARVRSKGVSLCHALREDEVTRARVWDANLERAEHSTLRGVARVAQGGEQRGVRLARFEAAHVLDQDVRGRSLHLAEPLQEVKEACCAPIGRVAFETLARVGLAGRRHEPQGCAQRIKLLRAEGLHVALLRPLAEVVRVRFARVRVEVKCAHAHARSRI